MIYVEMGGRYGNQLFHYACARYVQIKTGDTELILNYNSVLNKHNEADGWKDVLADLNVVPYSCYNKPGTVLKNESTFFQKILVVIKAVQIKITARKSRTEKARTAGWLQVPLNWSGIYWIREGTEFIRPNANRKCHIVTGTCECPSVFNEIGDVLRDELMPKAPVLESNRAILKLMEQTDSVCINVRRGDFFNTEFEKSFGVCTIDFYKKAYQRMLTIGLENPHFFVISDDIEWCKNHLKLVKDGGGVLHLSRMECRHMKQCA